MDQATLVRGVQRAPERADEVERAGRFKRPLALEQRGEVAAVDNAHCDVQQPVDVAVEHDLAGVVVDEPDRQRRLQRAATLIAHKANDKNMLLYEPPDPDDPRLRKQQGIRLDRREPTQPRPGGAL